MKTVSVDYVDSAYRILYGQDPPEDMPRQERMTMVMEGWDGRKFDGDCGRENTACVVLCLIGLRWDSDRPYDFSLVTERLREFMPKLCDTQVTRQILHEIVACKHGMYVVFGGGTLCRWEKH